MVRRKQLWIGGVVVVILAAAAMLSSSHFGKKEQASDSKTAAQTGRVVVQATPGNLAPDFTLQDLNGRSVKLSDLKGKPVILNFWASWCGPCRTEMPDLEAAAKAYQGKVAVYGVNLTDQDQEARARAFLQENRITFPVLLDPTGKVNEAYNIMNVPTTFAIDKDGVIREVRPGMLTRVQMDGVIERDLEGK